MPINRRVLMIREETITDQAQSSELLKMLSAAHERGNLEAAYEAPGVEERVLAFGNEVLAGPSDAALKDWLEIFALLSNLSLEGPPDITARLLRTDKGMVGSIASRSKPEVSRALIDFEHALDSPPLSFREMEDLSNDVEREASVQGSSTAASALPQLATFQVTQENRQDRVVRYTGSLIVCDTSGQELGRYNATTGGFVADYRRQYGPTPPGYFKVSNYRRRTEAWAKRGDIAFTFDIDELVHTGSRSAFRIHPDGPPSGTHGCVGLVEDGVRLEQCRDQLRSILTKTGAYRLLVTYGAGSNIS